MSAAVWGSGPVMVMVMTRVVVELVTSAVYWAYSELLMPKLVQTLLLTRSDLAMLATSLVISWAALRSL